MYKEEITEQSSMCVYPTGESFTDGTKRGQIQFTYLVGQILRSHQINKVEEENPYAT